MSQILLTPSYHDLYVNTISEVERITGMTFFPTLPKDLADSVKSQANLKDWNLNLFKRDNKHSDLCRYKRDARTVN